jgi:NitT/TauT family transport system permease protein
MVKKILPQLVFLFIFLLGWEMATRTLGISPLILPPPSQVVKVLVERNNYLFQQSAITCLASILGFGLGGIIATIIAIIFLSWEIARKAVYPYVIMFKAIPLIAIAPLIVTWFGTNLLSEVILAAIVSFFPILVGIIDGVKQVTAQELDIFTVYSATKWQRLSMLGLYKALPSIFAGMKVSISFAVVGAIVAEFISSSQGIGYLIKSSNYYLDTDIMFAGIFHATLIGLILFWMVELLGNKLVFWNKPQSN